MARTRPQCSPNLFNKQLSDDLLDLAAEGMMAALSCETVFVYGSYQYRREAGSSLYQFWSVLFNNSSYTFSIVLIRFRLFSEVYVSPSLHKK